MIEKIFLGSGREVGKYKYVACSMAIEDIEKYSKKAKNGKRYINFLVGKKKEKDQYGKTHWLAIDEYNPETKEERSAKQATENALNEEYGKAISCDDIPIVEDLEELDVKDIPF